MDYSQFLMMPQEIGLLAVFLLVVLYDTFMQRTTQPALQLVTVVLFGVYMTWAFLPPSMGKCFGDMFEANNATWAMKNILNIGVFIVLLQSVKWTNDDFVSVRRGEFYELILLTLLGMFLMVSARHFLLFVIGLETASLPLAALAAFEKRYYESREAAAKYVMTAVFSSAILLMGLSLVYGACGTLYFSNLSFGVTATGGVNWMLIVALAFVMAGV